MTNQQAFFGSVYKIISFRFRNSAIAESYREQERRAEKQKRGARQQVELLAIRFASKDLFPRILLF